MGNDTGNDTGTTERAYSSSEMATMLDIAAPTVRKYAQNLERQGYEFYKSQGGARLFVEKDIMAIRFLIDLRTKTNITVEQAASITIERFGKGPIQTEAGSDTPALRQYVEQYGQLETIIKGLTDRITQLEQDQDKQQEFLKQQQEYIDKRLKEHDQLLMESIRASQETRKLLAAAEEKKGFWQRLFKK